MSAADRPSGSSNSAIGGTAAELAYESLHWQTGGGLDVAVCAQPHLRRSQIACYVRTGSRFESEATNGLSHFLEHMIYRGTEGLPTAHRVNFAFEELGGVLYAATYVDYAVYAVSCPPESLAATSAIFGRLLSSPLFTDIDTERGIVLEEILEDLDDDGRDIDPDNASRRLMYPAHPLGYSITGSEERVRSFTVEDLKRHHRQQYGAGNVVLAYGGKVSLREAEQLAVRDFGRIAAAPRLAADAPGATAAGDSRLLYVSNRGSQSDVRVCFRAPSEASPQRAAIDMLMRLIDDGMSTRLYEQLCDKRGLCYQVSASYDGYEDDGVVDFAASCAHGRTLEVTAELLAVAKELAASGPQPAELAKAQKRARWDTLGMLDSAEDLVGFHAGARLFGRSETPWMRLQENLAVSAEQIQAVAAQIFSAQNLYCAVVGELKPAAESNLRKLLQNYA